MTNNVDLILDALVEQDKKWKINGEYQEPKREHVVMMLERGRAALEKIDGDEESTFESGGIIVKKSGGFYDVYVHVGELDLDEVEPD